MDDNELINEGIATDNGAAEVETTAAEAPAVANTEVSLDDAVKQAMEKHSEPDEKTEPVKAAEEKPVEIAKETDPVTGRALDPINAPAGMSPILREKWGGLDRQMQQYWVDRERDMSTKLNQTADERKLAKEFEEISRPYEAMFRSYGTTATTHTRELLNMSHVLHSGNGQQKAQIIDQLIRRYQPDINALVQYSSGGTPAVTSPAPQPVDVQAEVNKALAARSEAEQLTQAQQSVEAFSKDPKNEFFNDVQGLMRKAIEAEFVQGDTLPEIYQRAYEFACQQHPDVSKVIAQRAQAAASVQAPVAAQVHAKAAVRSVQPSLGSGKASRAPAKAISMDDAARQAMKMHGIEL